MLKRPCKTQWNSHYGSQKVACKAQEDSFLPFFLSSFSQFTSISITYCLSLQVINSILAANRKAFFFKGVPISAAEWYAVELLNKLLKVSFSLSFSTYLFQLVNTYHSTLLLYLKTFVDATAWVEGDGPTGCIISAEYQRVITDLKNYQAEASNFPSIDNAINIMIEWL